MYRLALVNLDVSETKTRVELPYNDVAPEDYCFYNVISEAPSREALHTHAIRLGFTPVGISIDIDRERNHYREFYIPIALEIEETIQKWTREQKQALVWVEIPEHKYLNLPIREKIGAMSEEDAESIHNGGEWNALAISQYGTDTEGNVAVIMEGWEFYHIAPLMGYTWQSVLNRLGVEGESPEPFGFEDDSDMCGECCVIDSRDNGYNYNFRQSPSGNYVGVNCGCYESACESEWSDNINEPNTSIELELARKLAGEGKIKFVARYIGGMTDPGRGGYFSLDDDATEAELIQVEDQDSIFSRGMSVNNGDPSDVLKKLLTENENGEYIMVHDESGQFQTYFSVWQVIGE